MHPYLQPLLSYLIRNRFCDVCLQGEERAEEKLPTSLERQSVQRSMETKWFYRDPQGQEQGPFSNEEMVEWFHHGYFTMQLSVRRHCDAIYFTLGTFTRCSYVGVHFFVCACVSPPICVSVRVFCLQPKNREYVKSLLRICSAH